MAKRKLEINLADAIHKYDNRKLQSTEELLVFHKELCDRARVIIEKKNSDYGAVTDLFRNFHGFGAFGILVRLSDKMARMRTFLEKLAKGEALVVVSESIEDTALDAINYIVLFLGYIRTWSVQK